MPETPESDIDRRRAHWRCELTSARFEQREARKIAAQATLSKYDVLRVVRGLSTDGEGVCEVTDAGIRAVPTPDDELMGNEVSAVGDYARSIKLDFPFTPTALLEWCGRNGYELVRSFERAAVEALRSELPQGPSAPQGSAPEQALGPGAQHSTKAVTSHQIKSAFRAIAGVRDGAVNAWWDERMRDAGRYGITEARAALGRGRNPSLWYPDLLASWLVEAKHATEEQAARALRRHFNDCSEVADLLDPPG